MKIRGFHLVIFSLYMMLFIPNFLSADDYTDTFTSGIDTAYWAIRIDDTLYTIDDTDQVIRFTRNAGGDLSFKAVLLRFKPTVYGDFDASIEYSEAYIDRVNGSPGNQVQLNTYFGGQTFSVVRSDEYGFGHNYHVWIDPPAQWRNNVPDTSS
jgi:hypothetical protein